MTLPPLVCTLVDASVDAAAVVDRQLELLYFNAQYLRLAGLRRRELVGRRVRGMCHEHFGLETCTDGCVAEQAFELGRTVRVDEVISNRQSLRLIVVAIPLLDNDGEVYAVIEQYRDVTAEGRLQDNYRALLDRERAQKHLLAQEVARQTAELERVNESLLAALTEVSRVARTDGLTGLSNRRAFDEQLRDLIARSERRGTPLSLVIFDLDHFKRINDQFGHPAGDEMLKDFARALTGSVREPHLVSRIGGEEFAVLLPGATWEDGQRVALRVQDRARQSGLGTTASAGVAGFPSDADNATALLRAADWALYAAKRAGRDCVVCARSLGDGARTLDDDDALPITGGGSARPPQTREHVD